MSKYQELMWKSARCQNQALEYLKKNEINLAIFYRNASVGFRQKALRLKVND